MLTRDQAEAIADAIHLLRPRWTTDELMAAMGDARIRERRSPKDVAAALAFMALDPETSTPARLVAPGRWWATAEYEQPTGPVPPDFRPLAWDDCHDCGRAKSQHPLKDCTYTAPVLERSAPDPEVMASIRASFTTPAPDDKPDLEPQQPTGAPMPDDVRTALDALPKTEPTTEEMSK